MTPPNPKIKIKIMVISLLFIYFFFLQSGNDRFNRGKLMNVGFTEALKYDNFDCFVFHDADLLPENDKNLYFCDNNVRQLSSAIDEMRYQ
jgi:hypothetical protein